MRAHGNICGLTLTHTHTHTHTHARTHYQPQCDVCEVFPIRGPKFECDAGSSCRMSLCTTCFRADLHAMSGTCSLHHPYIAIRYV